MTLDEQLAAINVQSMEVELLLSTCMASLSLGAYQNDHAHVATTRESIHSAMDRRVDLNIARMRILRRQMQGDAT